MGRSNQDSVQIDKLFPILSVAMLQILSIYFLHLCHFPKTSALSLIVLHLKLTFNSVLKFK